MLNLFDVANGIWGIRDKFVNLFIIKTNGNSWVLIDTGLKTSELKIKYAVAQLSLNAKPAAIILTHGHFDHTGSVAQLSREWNVPVYAHRLEAPFLTGQSSYPPPDPTAGGGMMSVMSFLYPKGPINIVDTLRLLPEDGTIQELPGWTWVQTPGHTPGHISLFRQTDRVLITGDALVTTRAESVVSTFFQTPVISGPPKYFTPDWIAARESIKSLALLKPEVVVSGHGMPLRGSEITEQINDLYIQFQKLAVPERGRYATLPAKFNERGITYVPPSKIRTAIFFASATTIFLATALLYLSRNNNKEYVNS